MSQSIHKDVFAKSVNPFASKVTIPESFILSGYFRKPYSTQTFQSKLFNYLDRPSGWKCLIYHLFIFSLVITTLTLSALETVRVTHWTREGLYYLEILLIVIFMMEYTARIWACGSQSSYQNFKGHLKYICRLANIFDLIILIGSVLSVTIGASEGIITASTMKLVQIVRIARIDRKGATWGLLSSVIYNHRKELITSLFIGFLGLLTTSYLMFVVENYYKPSLKFKSLADAFYWGVITVTTVGYGDITPETWAGKTVCACGAIFTISFFALPAGILGSGFALKVQQKQRQKHYNKQIPVAATLIQMMWRYNRTNCVVGSNATWSKHALTAGVFRHKHMDRRRAMIEQAKEKMDRPSCVKSHVTNDDFSDYENYELTSSQREQIRAISKIQFQVARRKFQQLRNPYDVRDVIEQYSQGHFHLMLKMKDLHRKLDCTVGNINEYKVRKKIPTVMESLEKLNKRMSQLEIMVASMHKVIMSMPAANTDSSGRSNIEITDYISEVYDSSPDESSSEIKSSFIATSDSSKHTKDGKLLFHNRFYLGHQSIISN